MGKKKAGWPFQEGYVSDGARNTHVFTDYRWNDATVTRCWKVDPNHTDLTAVNVHPFSLADLDFPN